MPLNQDHRAIQTVTNGKDCHLSYEPQTEEPFHWGKEIPTKKRLFTMSQGTQATGVMLKSEQKSPQWRLLYFQGETRILIYIISTLSTNPARLTLLVPFHRNRNRSCVESGHFMTSDHEAVTGIQVERGMGGQCMWVGVGRNSSKTLGEWQLFTASGLRARKSLHLLQRALREQVIGEPP